MTRDIIDVQYPKLDHENCCANINLVKQSVVVENGITIRNMLAGKNNPLFIIIDNLGEKSIMTVNAGDSYPNSMLGDICIEIPLGTSALEVHDLLRFIKTDCSIDLDFEEGFKGNICTIAKFKGA